MVNVCSMIYSVIYKRYLNTGLHEHTSCRVTFPHVVAETL